MKKYHVALSFAGEDRKYVEEVANELRSKGVKVFYDKFEETNLWGKDLYVYLRDIYQNKAIYTVIFVSKSYHDKLWTNHERESAQARAISESKEYILPAKFDDDVEIPGLLKTTGYINLKNLSPAEFAERIIHKLEDDGVYLSPAQKYKYSLEAKADVDFPMHSRDELTKIISELRSYNWYIQNPAIERIFELDLGKFTHDQLFVLGRNIYQCACGGERRATEILENLRREMAKFPIEVAEHIINGMFYEVYFDHNGNFRGANLKSCHITHLFTIQSLEKYENSINFIRESLQPYRDSLAVIPNKTPEKVVLKVEVSLKDPAVVTSIKFHGNELIDDESQDEDSYSRIWTLSFRKFNLESLAKQIYDAWHIPDGQLELIYDQKISPDIKFRLPKGKTIKSPFGE